MALSSQVIDNGGTSARSTTRIILTDSQPARRCWTNATEILSLMECLEDNRTVSDRDHEQNAGQCYGRFGL